MLAMEWIGCLLLWLPTDKYCLFILLLFQGLNCGEDSLCHVSSDVVFS